MVIERGHVTRMRPTETNEGSAIPTRTPNAGGDCFPSVRILGGGLAETSEALTRIHSYETLAFTYRKQPARGMREKGTPQKRTDTISLSFGTAWWYDMTA